jgi:hypothetical protein
MSTCGRCVSSKASHVPLQGGNLATSTFSSCARTRRASTPTWVSMYPGTEREVVIQQSVFSRHGTDRILKYAFELAAARAKRHLTVATKSNGKSSAIKSVQPEESMQRHPVAFEGTQEHLDPVYGADSIRVLAILRRRPPTDASSQRCGLDFKWAWSSLIASSRKLWIAPVTRSKRKPADASLARLAFFVDELSRSTSEVPRNRRPGGNRRPRPYVGKIS